MKYEKYKPSGIDWIGHFPNQWQFRRLKNVCLVNKDVLTEKTPHDYLIEYIDIGNTNENGEFIEVQETEFSEAPSRARRKVEHGDTIISTVRTYLRAIAFIENPKENLIVSTGFAVLNANKNILLPKFLFYQVLCDSFIQRVIANSEGVSYPAISSTKLADLKLFIPSIKEQLKIANYLDEQTQKIDRLIANKKAQAEKLKELRQIEINNAVTKGLNPKAELIESGFDWLGKIPKHWQLNRLKNLANQVSEKSTEILDDDFIVALENIESHNGKFIDTASEYENNGIKFKKDNLLYNKLRPYLNKVFLADRDGICVGDIIVIECTSRLHPTFLQFRMLSEAFGSLIMSSVYGAKMPRTSWEFISSLKIGYPSIEEQTKIANHLQDRTTAIEKLITNIETQIEKLQELRKIKIYEAVTGKIKVNAYAEATA